MARLERVRGQRFWYEGTYGPVYGVFVKDDNTALMIHMNGSEVSGITTSDAPDKTTLNAIESLMRVPAEVSVALEAAYQVAQVLHQPA